MKIGAWIHSHPECDLEQQIEQAARAGLTSLRSYSLEYAEEIAPALRKHHLSLLAGIHVDSEELIRDWRSQVKREIADRYHHLDVPLAALCIGNELRDGGDDPNRKRFTARLSFALTNAINAYREWLQQKGHTTPLTYAMEGIVCDREGNFHDWVIPLIAACDIVSINAYPMDNAAWFTFGAFAESRRFLQDQRVRSERLALYELQLRRILTQLEKLNKPVFLSETGFPSAIGYHIENGKMVIPESDHAAYQQAMYEFLGVIKRVNDEYQGRIKALYFYEWRDNLHHDKIWNIEQSPIHVAFGLCDRFGTPKFDIQELICSVTT